MRTNSCRTSRVHIPETFHSLMTDESSPIIDFYPETFDVDMNGKRMAWQGVALLPFIDEKRLLEAMATRYPDLTEDEIQRNKWGHNSLFVFEDNTLYPSLEALYGKRKNENVSLFHRWSTAQRLITPAACANRRQCQSRDERQSIARS